MENDELERAKTIWDYFQHKNVRKRNSRGSCVTRGSFLPRHIYFVEKICSALKLAVI